jgi:hypothetical protein
MPLHPAHQISLPICAADKQVPVDELNLSWILEVLPELDHLVGIFRSEFEPKNKQHVLSPHSLTTPAALNCVNGYAGEQKNTYTVSGH